MLSSPDHYEVETHGPQDLATLHGLTALDFGNNWCGYCQAAAPHIAQALQAHPQITHIGVADGPGKPLGRHFRVKLWPTVVLLRDGIEVARVVRPGSAALVEEAIAAALKT